MHFHKPLIFTLSLVLSLALSTSHFPAYAHGVVHDQIDDTSAKIDALSRTQTDELLPLYVKRGRLYIEDLRYRMAEKDFKRALKLQPDHANALYHLAEAAYLREKYGRAIKLADAFLNQLDADAKARMRGHHLQALAYFASEQYSKAAGAYERTIDSAIMAKPEYFLDLSACWQKLNEPEKAIAALRRGQDTRGSLAVFDDAIVTLYLENKQFTQALAQLDTMLARGQRTPFLLQKKGKVLLQAKRYEDAKHVLRQALESIAALPVARQNTPALKALKKDIESELAQLSR